MFKVLILLCSINMPQPDCRRDNAVDVIVGPDSTSSATCLFNGMAYAANAGFAPRPDEYLKTVCVRSSIGKSTIG